GGALTDRLRSLVCAAEETVDPVRHLQGGARRGQIRVGQPARHKGVAGNIAVRLRDLQGVRDRARGRDPVRVRPGPGASRALSVRGAGPVGVQHLIGGVHDDRPRVGRGHLRGLEVCAAESPVHQLRAQVRPERDLGDGSARGGDQPVDDAVRSGCRHGGQGQEAGHQSGG
ncbi:hypothetical protein ABE10_01820, partial [Bacillus toyonensis]|nr:hypothetical protein [Bacillus toyonensis]